MHHTHINAHDETEQPNTTKYNCYGVKKECVDNINKDLIDEKSKNNAFDEENLTSLADPQSRRKINFTRWSKNGSESEQHSCESGAQPGMK